MKLKSIIPGIVLSFVSVASFAKVMQPSESLCLESAVNQVLATSSADLHLVRDSKTSLVAKIINLDTQESYSLAFISENKGVEFISFENQTHLFNIWAKPTAQGLCEIIDVMNESVED